LSGRKIDVVDSYIERERIFITILCAYTRLLNGTS